MQNQSEKEITLFDIFDDILKGWYIFLITFIISIVASYVYFNFQKDIFTITLKIKGINDVEEGSLPKDLREIEIPNFFFTDFKSTSSIDKIIKEINLFDTLQIKTLSIYNNMSLNVSNESRLSFTTPNIRGLDIQEIIDDYKTLAITLLEIQREKSFNVLIEKYKNKLSLVEDLLKDEKELFLLSLNNDNKMSKLETNITEKQMKIMYLDIKERIKSNLQIAIDLGIENPIGPLSNEIRSSNDDNNEYFISGKKSITELDKLKDNLLSIISFNEYPLYAYGSFILDRELELMENKFLNLNKNFIFSIKKLESEMRSSQDFENTNTYHELLARKLEINRDIKHLSLLRKSKFNFINYDANQFIVSNQKLSLFYIVILSLLVTLPLCFLANIYLQVQRRKNNIVN